MFGILFLIISRKVTRKEYKLWEPQFLSHQPLQTSSIWLKNQTNQPQGLRFLTDVPDKPNSIYIPWNLSGFFKYEIKNRLKVKLLESLIDTSLSGLWDLQQKMLFLTRFFF